MFGQVGQTRQASKLKTVKKEKKKIKKMELRMKNCQNFIAIEDLDGKKKVRMVENGHLIVFDNNV